MLYEGKYYKLKIPFIFDFEFNDKDNIYIATCNEINEFVYARSIKEVYKEIYHIIGLMYFEYGLYDSTKLSKDANQLKKIMIDHCGKKLEQINV